MFPIFPLLFSLSITDLKRDCPDLYVDSRLPGSWPPHPQNLKHCKVDLKTKVFRGLFLRPCFTPFRRSMIIWIVQWWCIVFILNKSGDWKSWILLESCDSAKQRRLRTTTPPTPPLCSGKGLTAKNLSSPWDPDKTRRCPLVYPGQGQRDSPNSHSLPHKLFAKLFCPHWSIGTKYLSDKG